MRILSLGVGVQSSTIALMISKCELPSIDCGIFADTGWEPKAVYEYFQWLKSVVPFPIYTVSAGNIRDDLLRGVNSTGQRFAAVPFYTMSSIGKKGMGRRQCTAEYKLRPLQKKVVELLGGRPKGGCKMLIGISTDEYWRMKPSRVQYIVNQFPLIDAGMSRADCVEWIRKNGYPEPPKSSCIGCPFHSDKQWRSLTTDEFDDAIEVDLAIRNMPKFRSQQFMHRSCKPLKDVDFSTPEENGQLNMFINECEGMCGV